MKFNGLWSDRAKKVHAQAKRGDCEGAKNTLHEIQRRLRYLPKVKQRIPQRIVDRAKRIVQKRCLRPREGVVTLRAGNRTVTTTEGRLVEVALSLLTDSQKKRLLARVEK